MGVGVDSSYEQEQKITAINDNERYALADPAMSTFLEDVHIVPLESSTT